VAVPGVLVDGGDDPVLGDLAGDPEHPVLGLLQILADDAGEQLRRLLHRLGQLPPVQQRQAGVGVPGPAVDQLLTGLPVVPVDLRLAGAGVVIAADQHRPQLTLQLRVGDLQQATQRRTDQRQGSIVATASYNGVESNTRRAPTNPADAAAANVTSKIRRGLFDAASRARMSTSTVCANEPQPSPS